MLDLTAWHDYQRWLGAGETRVVIPYAVDVARLTLPRAVRMRRDFSQCMRTVKAHALLHREHRERDDKGRIIATKQDYGVVYDLMELMLAQSSETKLGKKMANLFDVVKALQPEDVDKGVTVNQVRDKLKRGDRTTIWRQLKKLEEGRYLENLAHYGATARYRTAGRRPKPMNVLPTVEQVMEEFEKREGEGADMYAR